MSLGSCKKLGAMDQVQILVSLGCKMPAWLGSRYPSEDLWRPSFSTPITPH